MINKIKITPSRLPLKFSVISDYLTGKRTPARILADEAIKTLLPSLTGTVVELGAAKTQNYHLCAASAEEYIFTNIKVNEAGVEFLDVMNMHYGDSTVDSFVCVAVLEHVSSPQKAIAEIYRVLKPKGKVLLILPFIFPFHSAPDDFFRFSSSACIELLKEFRIIHFEALGNYWSALSFFLQRPRCKPFPRSVGWWPWDISLRFLGLFCCLVSCLKKETDDYTMLYCVIAQKPGDGK